MATSTIVPVVAGDIPNLGPLIHQTKLGLAINRFLFKDWPDNETQASNSLNAVKGSWENPDCTMLKAVDDTTDELVGFMVLTKKQQAQDQTDDAKTDGTKPSVPTFFNEEVFTAVTTASELLAAPVKGIEHYEVTYILVTRGHTGKGIGTRMIDIAKEKARADGIPLVIGTEPQIYNFAKKNGFQDTAHYDFDLAKWAPPFTGYGLFRLSGTIWKP